MKVTERLIARHELTNTVFDRLLNTKATRREEAQAVAASLRDFRLTWRRNTQLQIIWLWKWLENHRVIASFHDERTNVYSICYFGSLIFFKHSKIMVGEALLLLLPLTARHWSPRCFAGVCWLLGYLRQHLFCRALRLAFPYPAYAEHIQHGW